MTYEEFAEKLCSVFDEDMITGLNEFAQDMTYQITEDGKPSEWDDVYHFEARQVLYDSLIDAAFSKHPIEELSDLIGEDNVSSELVSKLKALEE